MGKEEKKVARKRFDEIMGVAKNHHLANLLKDKGEDENFEVSDLRYAMEELGPAFIKLGQLLATRPDMVGNEIADDLKLLRDNTPLTPFDEIREVIEGELGQPLEEIYSEFNEEPLGFASIGQVYKATLKENGMDVAVKVQKPGIREVIEPDVKILIKVAGTVDKYVSKSRTYNLPAMAKEFERSIFKELNYLEEVKNIGKITKNFEDVEYIKIPEVYPQLCTSKVINMELIDGYELPDLYDNEIEGINNAEIAQYGCQSYLKQVLIDGFFHADPHPGNLFVTRDNRLCYIDFGMIGVVNDTFRSNFAQLVLLLLDGNSHHLINQLLYMNIITPEQNTDEFKEDIDDLLNSYLGVDMDQMDGIFDDLMNVMIRHNIILPREFVMIGRGIILIEEAGDKLDPHFNLTAELEKFAKDMIKSKFEPGNLVGGGFNYIVEIEHLLKDLPDRLNSTLDKVEKGEIELTMNHTGLDDLKNQLSISLIVSALLVGSSIAIMADKGPKVWDISAIGFLGFLFSAILGIYLIIKYIRN
ncbi:ABC1 kinase family protein [Methanobrevibacter millerae]|uniref:Ubiquinone biosynthesis protein n=1 Tax=Methanobrevibacter millerae TaxID=230361 RepID=A0A1G5UWA4_9EURY|nr:AarF/ABC1/UbiB kinase family protein [Methanobrevibacter millerae]SDA37618.1 ubiquinone biosynthesis protein [Methanobrevibacter millerae]